MAKLAALRPLVTGRDDAFNFYDVIAADCWDGGTQKPAQRANRLDCVPIFTMPFDGIVGPVAIVQGAGGADLQAGAATGAGGFSTHLV